MINAVATEDAPLPKNQVMGQRGTLQTQSKRKLNETKQVYSAGPSAGPTPVLKDESSVSRSFLGVLRWESLSAIWFSDLLQDWMDELLLGNYFTTGSGLACVC